MNYKEKFIYVCFIILTMCLFLGMTYKIAHASILDWLLGGTSEVVITFPQKTLDSEIDRLAIKYEVSSSTIRAVAKCESQLYGDVVNKNYDKNGNVWSSDWGYLQVNDYFHKSNMEALGLDIYNSWDSLEYGIKMMSEQGLQPWSASRHCWSKLI